MVGVNCPRRFASGGRCADDGRRAAVSDGLRFAPVRSDGGEGLTFSAGFAGRCGAFRRCRFGGLGAADALRWSPMGSGLVGAADA
jgi:hypothetical protein